MHSKYATLKRFERSYKKLPEQVKKKVKKTLNTFKDNPRHPGLRAHEIESTDGVWEMYVDNFYRITYKVEEDVCYFRNVGPHNIIDRSP